MPTPRRALSSLTLGVCLALAALPGLPLLPAQAQTAPTSAGEPQATNTGSVPAGAPAVNPASPPGTAYNQPNAGSIGPSPAGTVPSTSSAPLVHDTRVNPATGALIAPPPGGAPKGPPGAGPNRLNFELKFAPEKGQKEGGAAAGSAVTLDYKRDDYAVLTGLVQVHYQDLDLSADHVEINLTTKEVVAQGNVILDQGPKRMTGTTLNFDLDTKTGKMLQATAFVAADYYFAGVEIDKTGEDSYTVFNGIFTACDQKTPDWSFRLQRADVDVEGYAHMRRVTFRVKQLPVLYTPYLLYPAKKDRASGFLVPTVEYTGKRGAALNLAYFQTLGQSYDTTFHLTPFLRGYVGGGDEFRYHPTEGTWGDIDGYAVRDPVENNKLRWKIDATHDTEDLPFGMRLVAHYQKYSDFDYLRDFERDFDTSSLRFIDSRAFITGNWGPNLLNIQLDNNQILFNTGTDFVSDVDQKKLPEFEYQLRSTKIGPTPFYIQMDNFLDYLEINRPGSYSGSYGRLDLFPQITLPVNTFPWLNLSLTGGYRFTEYQKSLNGLPVPDDTVPPTTTVPTTPTTGTAALLNQSLTRSLPYGSAEIVGPSFSKIYDYEFADFAKFKHVIEPRITYTYYGQFTDQQQLKVPQFDDIDAPLSTNNVRIALDNRLLAKPDTADASAREILLFEIARMYSFDPNFPLDQSTVDLKKASDASPIDIMLRFNPTDKLSTKGEVEYSTFFSRIESTSLSSDWSFGTNQTVGLTWFTNYIPESGVAESNQVRVNTALDIIPQKLSIQAQIGWDVQNHLIGQQYYALNWASQCYGFRLEFRKFEALTGPRLSDSDIRFSVTLKGIGTLLDLNSRAVNSTP